MDTMSRSFEVQTALLRPVPVTIFRFAGGEVQVKVGGTDWIEPGGVVRVTAHLHSADDVLALILLVDALRRKFGAATPISLFCPYLPYARQDRVMESGESLSLKVMCDLINGLGFTRVEVCDVHSDVALALLNNVHNYPPSTFVQLVPVVKQNTVLVAPDAGALKKVGKLAKGLGYEMVRADKVRSTADGSITGTTVYSDHIGDRDFLIVDDICDGGRTFIELAKVLRPLTAGRVLLYVTHGIFSRGLEPLLEHIDQIFVAYPFPDVDLANPLLKKVTP